LEPFSKIGWKKVGDFKKKFSIAMTFLLKTAPYIEDFTITNLSDQSRLRVTNKFWPVYM
jgi:hypothetical protein